MERNHILTHPAYLMPQEPKRLRFRKTSQIFINSLLSHSPRPTSNFNTFHFIVHTSCVLSANHSTLHTIHTQWEIGQHRTGRWTDVGHCSDCHARLGYSAASQKTHKLHQQTNVSKTNRLQTGRHTARCPTVHSHTATASYYWQMW